MAKGRFNVKGTKDFLVMAVACAFLCLWSIRDAWFPSKKVLEKHPQSVEVAMKVSGVIKSIPLLPGHEITGSVVLAEVYDESHRKALAAAEAAFEAAKEARAADVEEKLDAMLAAREELNACTLRNTDLTQKTSHGEDALRGKVIEHLVQPATYVEAGDPILLVEPTDTFYAFNKTLALLTFMGALVALFFHRIASR
jgi:multidrug resistance efflux pump